MKLKMVESSEKERKTVPSTLDAELTMDSVSLSNTFYYMNMESENDRIHHLFYRGFQYKVSIPIFFRQLYQFKSSVEVIFLDSMAIYWVLPKHQQRWMMKVKKGPLVKSLMILCPLSTRV